MFILEQECGSGLFGLFEIVLIEDCSQFGIDLRLLLVRNVGQDILHFVSHTALAFGVQDMICEFFRRAVPRANIGTQLAHLMQDAGLTMPECRFDSIIACGPNATVYAWIVECLHSVLPRMSAVGLSTAHLGDINTLTSRMLQEAEEVRGVNFSPPLIGVFDRKPYSR